MNKNMSGFICTAILLISFASAAFGNEKFVFTENPGNAYFPLISNGMPANVFTDESDKRGTIYGIYELSKQMGVSPWYWWADVPVELQKNLYVKHGVYTEGAA